MIDDSYYNMIHSSLTADHCFDNSYVGKQPMALEEYCVEYRKSWIGAVVVTLICLPVTTTWADPTMTELHYHNNFHTVIPNINDDDDDEIF